MSLQETLDALLTVTWGKEESQSYQKRTIQEVINYEVIRHMIALHASSQSGPLTKAIVLDKLESVASMMEGLTRPMSKQAALAMINILKNPQFLKFPPHWVCLLVLQ